VGQRSALMIAVIALGLSAFIIGDLFKKAVVLTAHLKT
jgi:hypothetical protein